MYSCFEKNHSNQLFKNALSRSSTTDELSSPDKIRPIDVYTNLTSLSLKQNMVIQTKKRPVIVLKNNQGNFGKVEGKSLSSLSSSEEKKFEEPIECKNQSSKPERYE